MNPYYAAGFMSALTFWVWPAFLFKNFDAHWLTVVVVSALLFLGVGKLATEFHIDHIAPNEPPRGRTSHIAILCGVVFALGLLMRVCHYFVAGDV
jgi:hypothetical protein